MHKLCCLYLVDGNGPVDVDRARASVGCVANGRRIGGDARR